MSLQHASTSAASSSVKLLRRSLLQLPCGCRHASTSTSNKATTAPSLFQRIRAAADRAAVNARPIPVRVEREIQQRELEQGMGSIFDRLRAGASATATTATSTEQTPSKIWLQHKTSTGNISISPRKLNDVARLIAKMPIDTAILQMQMSDKRVAKTRIKSMLALARDHAVMKGLPREQLIVKEAWVSKGIYAKRLDIKGRGRHGVIMKPEARMHVVLAPGPSRAEIKAKVFHKRVTDALRTGAGFSREDRKIVNLRNLKGEGVAYAW